MRLLFMSLVIHYWIGAVQDSQGVSVLQNVNSTITSKGTTWPYCAESAVKLQSIINLVFADLLSRRFASSGKWDDALRRRADTVGCFAGNRLRTKVDVVPGCSRHDRPSPMTQCVVILAISSSTSDQLRLVSSITSPFIRIRISVSKIRTNYVYP